MKKIFSAFLSLVIFSFLTIPNFFADDPPRRRQKFMPEEDQRLIELVNEHGTSDWVLIASLMENRNPRQCRERWKHYLSVRDTRKEPFSPEEDRAISEKFNELGPKWTKIATFLPGRSDIDIKHRFLTSIRYQHIPVEAYVRSKFYKYSAENIVPPQLDLHKEVVNPVPLEMSQNFANQVLPKPNQRCGVPKSLKSRQDAVDEELSELCSKLDFNDFITGNF